MELFVETPTGERRTIQVEATETFESIKAKILGESGSPSSARSFRLQGLLLEDRTPRYYRLKTGDTIHIMQIFVNTPTGKKITLEVNRYDTLMEVKKQIEEQTEILARKQLLLFADSTLEDGKTVYDSNLNNGDTIELTVNGIEIFIKMPTGKRILLEINRNDAIVSVKNQIQTKEGIPQQYQELFYGRKNLQDDCTVQYYEITGGITLHLVQHIIEIFVQMPTKEKITIDVHRNDTIGDVKGKIEEKGVLTQNYILDFGPTSLEDDLTVDDYKIKQGSTLTLRLNDIEMDIIMPSGELFPLNVKLNETISSVKTKIEQMKGISPENQFFLGKEPSSGGWAKDDDTVISNISYDHYGRKGHYLHMVNPTVSITVEMTTGQIRKRMTLSLKRNATLGMVKSKIAEKENFNLETHFFCLCDFRRSDDDTVEYLLSKDLSPRLFLELKEFDISIFIKTLTDKTFPIAFHRKDTGMHVKEYIQDKEGIHPGEQRLIFAGHLVEDFRTLASYNIKNGDTIHLILPPRGN